MAVTANQVIKKKDGDRVTIPADNVNIYEGTFVFRDSSGYGTSGVNSGANPFVGIAVSQCDNSGGADGDLDIELYNEGMFVLTGSGFSQADVGKTVFASDNYTITLTQAATVVPIGRVREFISSTQNVVELKTGGAAGAAIALTEITHEAIGTPDYAIANLINPSAWGFESKDEANTVLSVIKNLQQRVAALELRA